MRKVCGSDLAVTYNLFDDVIQFASPNSSFSMNLPVDWIHLMRLS
jgi:hypothetical protein